MMEQLSAFISNVGRSDFLTGLATLVAIVGPLIAISKGPVVKILSLVGKGSFARARRLQRLRRFRQVEASIAAGATPYVNAALEWRNCVRWAVQIGSNFLWIALNAILAAKSEHPNISYVAIVVIMVVAFFKLYQLNAAADRAWENPHWTAYPRGWKQSLLSERIPRK